MGKEQSESCCCPFCKGMEAVKHSHAAKHLHGVERDMLVAARGMIDWCIDHLDKKEGGETAETSRKIDIK